MKTIDVNTKYGIVTGYQENDINYFRGIPYANTLRFEKPTPFYFKDGHFDATRNEVDCPQHSTYYKKDMKAFYNKEFYDKDKTYEWDESYMTLNVIAPSNKKNMDTMIFIHGGSFTLGCTNDIPYGLSDEYAKKDIILVSLGYRLNIFASYNSDNLALHDLLFAINWVKDNIENFGGSKRITLCGQSAGAFLIQDLLYSDKLKGIINGAILMSGGGIIPYMLGPGKKNKFKKHFDGYLKSVNCKNKDDLKKLSTEELFKSFENYKPGLVQFMSPTPQVDFDTIKDYPRKLVKNKKTLDIPIIFGITKDDMFPPVLIGMAKRHAKYHYKNNMSKTFMYFFKRESPGDKAGAFHACDLAYCFGMKKMWRPFEEIDYKIKDQMVSYFSNFIHTGDPNGDSLPVWEYAMPNNIMKVFDENIDDSIKISKARRMTKLIKMFPENQD